MPHLKFFTKKKSLFLFSAAVLLAGGFLVISSTLAVANGTTSVTVSPTAVAGNVSKEYTFTVANNGSNPINLIRITAPAGFTITGNVVCPTDSSEVYDWSSSFTGAYASCLTSGNPQNTNVLATSNSGVVKFTAASASPANDTLYDWSVYTEDNTWGSYTNTDAKINVDVTSPIISTITTKDANSDGKVETATIVFNEPVDDSTFSADNFTLGGAAVNSINTGETADDNTFDIAVTAGVAGTEAKDVTYTQGTGADMVGNLLANIITATVAEVDGAKPKLMSAQTKSPTTIDVTFSEDLDGNTVTNADFSVNGYTLTTPDATDTGTPGIVHLTVSAPFGTGETPAVTYNTTTSNGVKDSSDNQALAAGPITPADGVAPVIASSRTVTTTTIEVTFSEVMSAVNKNDFAVAGNTISSVSFTAPATTATLVLQDAIGTGATPNVTTVETPASTKDNATAPNTIMGSLTSTPVDDIAPTVTLTSTAISPTKNSPIPMTATFSETVTGFAGGDITIGNGAVSNFSAVSGTVYTFDVTPASQGAETVDIAGAAAKDAADNDNTAATQFNITYDSVAPTVGLTKDHADLIVRDADIVVITATFNENMASAPVISINAVTDDITNAAMSGSGTSWTYSWNVPANNDGAAVVTVAGADLAGNAYVVSDNLTFTIDNIAPTPVSQITPVTTPINDNTPNVVIGVENNVGWLIKNGADTVTSGTGTGVDQPVTLPILSDGLYDLDLLATDTAGNSTQIDLTQFRVDTTAPSVNAGTDKLANAQFSQDATATDGGSGIASYAWTKNSGTGTITFGTPAAEDTTISASTDGSYVIRLTVTDNAGNSASDDMTLVWDTTAPTVGIVLADPALKVGETSLVTFTFSEPITGFTNADITTIDNGTLTAVSSSDGGTTWIATFTPTDATTDATNVITVNKTGVADLAGNAGVDSTSSANYTIDTVRPTITVTMGAATFKTGETTTVTFTFSEAPSGFTTADVTVGSGTIGEINATDPLAQTATYTPTNNVEDDTNVITVGTDWTDLAGNALSAGDDSPNYTVDTKKPSVVLASETANPTNGLITVAAEFSENVSNFVVGDITVGNGVAQNFVAVDGNSYTFNVDPDNGGNVAVSIQVAADNAVDSAGNNNTASNQLAYTSDTVAPDSPVISHVASDEKINNAEKAAIVVTGTAEANSLITVTLTNGANSKTGTQQLTGNATSFSVTIDGTAAAPGALADGTITPAVTARDAAGNTSIADSDPTATQDTVAPTITSITSNATVAGWLKVSDTITFTLTPGAAEVGANVSGSYNGVSLSWSPNEGSTAFTASYTVAESNTDQTSALQISGVTITDSFGNTSTAGSGSDVAKIIDAHTPVAPTTVTLLDPINNSNKTAATLRIVGESGTTYNYSIEDATHGSPVTGTGTLISADLTVHGIDVSALDNGTLTASVTLTDAAGNVSSATTDTATKDAAVPSAPVISSIATDNKINNAEKVAIVVAGTAEANSLVTVSLTSGATVTGSQQLSGDATAYSITIDGTTLTDGTVTPSVTATDASGNVSSADADPTALKDTIAPAFTVTDGTAAGPVTSDTINITVTETNFSTSKYGFSANNTCDGSDTITTDFISTTGFSIAGDHADYLCIKATDTSGNETYQLVGQLNTDNTDPALDLGSMFTSQTLTGGNVYPINWTASDTHLGDTAMKVEYSINGGTTWTAIIENSNNDGTENWTVPSVNTSNGKIKVTATDLAGNSTEDLSSTFNITYSTVTDTTAPTATLNSPNGGETWENNAGHTITWTATDNVTAAGNLDVKLEYSTDGGTVWTTIIADTENDGAYSWTPTGITSSNVLIKITATDAANLTGSDISNTAFTVAAPVAYPASICTGPDENGDYSCSVNLSSGWNLISFPIIPASSAITDVLNGFSSDDLGAAYIDTVQYYDGHDWMPYSPAGIDTLTTMEDGKGYWINVKDGSATLTVTGTAAPAAPNPPSTYSVISGWNLIGYKSLTAYQNASSYLSTIPSGYIVFDQSNTNKTSSYLQHGKGYWLWSTGAGSIVAGD